MLNNSLYVLNKEDLGNALTVLEKALEAYNALD